MQALAQLCTHWDKAAQLHSRLTPNGWIPDSELEFSWKKSVSLNNSDLAVT